MADAAGINLAHWDELASIHGRGDRIYDVDALVGGWDSRTRFELDAVEAAVGSDLAGVRILHLQSHIGFDAISMARLGADVTCADFSPVALERARELADRCGVEIDTVEADATDLPHSLSGGFDLVYANIGAICWIEDLAAWMRAAAGALKPGGAFTLYEIHPACLMLETAKPPKFGYSYADADADVSASKAVSYAHSVGETVNATIDAGLTIERLDEHMESEFDVWGNGDMEQEDDGFWRVRLDGQAFPLFFTLIARKPAG